MPRKGRLSGLQDRPGAAVMTDSTRKPVSAKRSHAENRRLQPPAELSPPPPGVGLAAHWLVGKRPHMKNRHLQRWECSVTTHLSLPGSFTGLAE